MRQLPVRLDGDPHQSLRFMLRAQDGMITGRQLAELGFTRSDVARMVRRRDLCRTAAGVFVDHTGVLTWDQRAWSAVMQLWPAALSHLSVWQQTSAIHVAIERHRSPRAPAGVVVHRMSGFDDQVLWRRSPPRVRVERAAIDVVAPMTDPTQQVATLSSVVQRRLTSYPALLREVGSRPNLVGRQPLSDLLDDLSSGANSVLEHAYLTKIELPHGLPRGERQAVSYAGGRRNERDVNYRPYVLAVELDGRTHHDTALARFSDLERDLAAAVEEGLRTVRLGYRQVVSQPCHTTMQIVELLRQGGWQGTPRACPDCPPRPHGLRYA